MKFSLIFASPEERANARRRAASAWITPLELGMASPSMEDDLLPELAACEPDANADAWTDTASGRVGDRLDPAAIAPQDAQASLALAAVGMLGAGHAAPPRNGHDAPPRNGRNNGSTQTVAVPLVDSLTLMEVGTRPANGMALAGNGAAHGGALEIPLRALPPRFDSAGLRALRAVRSFFAGSGATQRLEPALPPARAGEIEAPAPEEPVQEPKGRENGCTNDGPAPAVADARLNARISRSANTRRARVDAKAEAASRGRIGAILVAAQRMSADDAQRVAEQQAQQSEPFGEVAIRLGVASRADVHFALAQQFSLPRLEAGDSSVDPEVVAAFDPGHERLDHLRGLRNQIALRALDATPSLRSIAVVGAERRIGRSYVAANLATVFAQLGARTLLIDADFVGPRQHELFKLGNRAGLSSVLAGRADLGSACQVAGLPGFAVLPAGPTPPNPHDLIARPSLARFLRQCEQEFDVILVDTPAWNSGTAARMVAAAAGAALLLVQSGRTAATDASAIAREFAGANTRLIGAVLNRPH